MPRKSKRSKNIDYLKYLGAYAHDANTRKINNIINLYRDSNIDNVRTAANAIISLSGSHYKQQEKGKRQYKTIKTKAIQSAIKKHVEDIRRTTDSAIASVEKTRKRIKTDDTLKIGNHSKVSSFIDFVINDHDEDENGFEKKHLHNFMQR